MVGRAFKVTLATAMLSAAPLLGAFASGLPGDCDGDWSVSIGEVQRAVNMFLGTAQPACGADANGDGTVSIGEVQKVVNGFLGLIPVHTITATAGPGGSVDPTGEVLAAEGTSQAFALRPDLGMALLDVAVDGASVGAVPSYTFEDVRSNHALHATFTALCQEPLMAVGPEGQQVAYGATATLEVEASGTEPLAYQWYLGESGDDAAPVAGATSASYTTPPLTESASYWVRVSNACGGADSLAAVIVVAPVLSLACSGSPEEGIVPLGVAFTAEPSGGAPPYAYAWDFGDGSGLVVDAMLRTLPRVDASPDPLLPPSHSGTAKTAGSRLASAPGGAWRSPRTARHDPPTANHTYTSPGTFTWTLTVTDASHATAACGGTVAVYPPLSVTASADPAAGNPPLAVDFAATTSGGKAPYTYAWAFGDGTTSTEQAPGHTYAAVGTYAWTLQVADAMGNHADAGGTVTVSEIPTHTLTVSLGEGATGTPASTATYAEGTVVAYAYALASDCHEGLAVRLDGVPVPASGTVTMDGDHALAVTASVKDYTITATAGTGGSISPSGAVSLPCGSNRTFSISPSAGYAIQDVAVDGASVGAVSSYSFVDVRADRTIRATFAPETYTVTFVAGTGGTLSGDTPQTVSHGGSTTPVTAVPDTGYAFVNWTGTGGFTSTAKSLTITNVTGDMTVTANFQVDPEVQKDAAAQAFIDAVPISKDPDSPTPWYEPAANQYKFTVAGKTNAHERDDGAGAMYDPSEVIKPWMEGILNSSLPFGDYDGDGMANGSDPTPMGF